MAFFFLGSAHAADVIRDSATPAERALLAKIDAEQYIKARDEAEAILAKSPDSFVADWAMALIHHNEEGNHARALYFIHRAEDVLTRRYHRDPEWHKKIILEECEILREMDRNADVLKLLDRYDQLYQDSRPYLRIWPLFKLGRVEEARAIAVRLAASDDWNERAEGYNGMLALEFEAHDREASYRWSVNGVRATQERSCVILRNAAGSAFSRFRLREAEDFALRAHKAKESYCPHAGYDQLAGLYIMAGEFQKALSAIETLKREKLPKRYRPHFALTRRMILADLLYALGKVEEGERMAAELYGLPERTGMTSGSMQAERFARSFRYYMALGVRLAWERERRSYRPLLSAVSVEPVRMATVQWEVGRGLRQLAADGDVLVTLTRPNLGEINEWTAWRVGGLIDVLGTGVMTAAVNEARARDADFPEAKAYFASFAGEIAFREGRWAEADRRAVEALAGLPKEEGMLRWRTMAWQADALWRLGRVDAARPIYQEVLRQLPSALRFLDLRLPATIAVDGTPLARKAGERLAGSSRFAIARSAPFRLQVSARDGAVEVCLNDDAGSQLACGIGERRDREDDTVASGLDAFHAAAFSPKVSLKQSDLNSLDGSPVRVGADELLKGVLAP